MGNSTKSIPSQLLGTAALYDVGTAANNVIQLDSNLKLPAVDSINLINAPDIVGGRLTLATGIPVMTASSTTSSTVYYTPYISNRINLYNGTLWIPIIFSEVSLSLIGLIRFPSTAYHSWVSGIGSHYVAAVEQVDAGGTMTSYGFAQGLLVELLY